jgi:uncharacterized protein
MNPLEIIDKYYSQSPQLRELLITHSVQVRDRALKIASSHPELHADEPFIAEAAMLHDIGIIYCNAPRIFCVGTHEYIEHGFLGAELLRAEGLPRHADVAERHTGTGLTLDEVRQNNWPIPLQDYSPRTIEEQIICYADKFYSKSHLTEELTLEHVRRSMWKYGSDSVARFDKWQHLFEPDLR